jgi:hypothetical protein
MDKNEVAKEIIVAAINKDMFFNEADQIGAISSAFKAVRKAVFEAEMEEVNAIKMSHY